MKHSTIRKWLAATMQALVPLALLAAPTGKTCKWTGAGVDAKASTAENWEDGVVPVAGDDILLDTTGRDNPMTWDLDVPVNTWTQDGYTNVVTIGTSFGSEGFTNLIIQGDCLLNSGVWTHQKNSKTEAYRLRATIGGNLTLGAESWISANGLGLAPSYRPEGMGKTPGATGGAYGSQAGSWKAEFPFQKPYGNVYKPENLGSGGTPGWGDTAGGGALYLDVAGHFLLEGKISADAASPRQHYNGSGGSVYVRAGSITGRGTISADSAATAGAAGSGGRVAIILTDEGAGFSGYDIVKNVSAVSRTTDIGAPGTIYAETRQDGPKHGWLVMKGAGKAPPRSPSKTEAHILSEGGRLEFSRITLTNRVVVSLLEGTILDLSSVQPEVDDLPGVVNGFRFFGGRIIGPADKPLKVDYRIIADKMPEMRLDAGAVVFTNSGFLEVAVPTAVASDLSFTSGSELLTYSPLSVDGDLVFSGGTKATAPGPVAVDPVPVDITVSGDCTIEDGAKIDMFGRGYTQQHGPGFGKDSCGGSHGGKAGNPCNGGTSGEPYGSICNPVDAGSGGSRDPGGGIVLLHVGGHLLLDGEIDVSGELVAYYGGAAGSINITAGSLAGTGRIDASLRKQCGWSTAGGGRIAIALTKTDATIDSFQGTITAAGCQFSNQNRESGGAGTIYIRERGQGVDEGTLVIDNEGRAPCAPTIVGGNSVPDLSCGSVIIRGGGRLLLAENSTLSLSRDFTNGAVFLASAGSSVSFRGMGPSLISGDSTFCNFVGNAPGKTISFAAGSTQCVTGVLKLAGSDVSHLVLRSTEPGTSWNLSATGPVSVGNVHVSDSDASAGDAIVAANSENGGNNIKWSFMTILPGEEIAWTGAGNSSWDDAANWSPKRLPVETDEVTIPADTPFQPTLGGPVRIAKLTVSAGASLALAERNLAIDGDCIVSGRIVASRGETISIGGNLSLSGFVPAVSTVVLNGTGDQAVSASGVRFNAIRIAKTSGATSFQSPLNAGSLACGDGATAFDIAFATGSVSVINSLMLSGDSISKNGILRGTTSGGRWSLNVSDYSITGVTVRDCDASSGVAIYPLDSADGGNNLNWFFSDTRKRWTGSADGEFANGANWEGGVVPGADDDVYIEGSRPLSVGSALVLGSVTIGSGATLSVSEDLNVARSVTVENGGALVWNQPGVIGGNLVLLDGATMTHDANGVSDEKNKIDLVVHGNGYIAEGASIDVTGKGYAKGGGPGCANGGFASSHGGRGYNTGNKAACYGSIISPTNCGSAGSRNWGNKPGGGAVRLSFDGAFTLNGDIIADGIGFDPEEGNGHYNGAGGSVYLTAGSFSGAGKAFACGGNNPSAGNMSGGGRVAVKLTAPGEDFGSFTGTLSARGGQYADGVRCASSGTIYTELPDQAGGRGLVLVEGGDSGINVNNRMTDFPSSRLCEEGETKKTSVLVTGEAVLHLTGDATVKDLHLEGSQPILRLNGHTLTIRSKQHPLGVNEDKQVTYSDGGQVLWAPYSGATLLMLR